MVWNPKSLRNLGIHLIVWLGFVFLMSSKAVDLTWGFFARSEGSILFPLLYGTAFSALIFYGNYYFLIPKYFSQQKKFKYWLLAIGFVLLVCFLETLVDVLVLSQKQEVLENIKKNPDELWDFVVLVFANTVTANLACLIFAFAYRFPKDWMKNERQKNQLEKDKLRSELDFLRAQINPHFLFNGINSIYHLIGANNEVAKDTLLQFSGLLRYQLYECNVDFIPLHKELAYLKNYIHIEEIRKGEDAVFQITLPETEHENFKMLKIAPLLISPFLENAFKYLSHNSEREKNYVSVNLSVEERVLFLTIENSTDPKMKRKPESNGGIGLANVKRRLKLIYPDGKHQLKITPEKRKFSVTLKLELHED